MTTAAETITLMDTEQELSRLRFLVGSLREEAWDLIWAGLEMDKQRYDDETDRLAYGGK
jgi:hypothetical protein